MPRHELTPEDRSKAGHTRAENIRQRHAAAAERVAEKLDVALDRAVEAIVEAMEAEAVTFDSDGGMHTSPAHRTRVAAADKVLDRAIGRATQRTEHTGTIDHTIVTAEARAYLARKLTSRAERHAEADDPAGADG